MYIGKHSKDIKIGSFFRNENISASTTFPVSFDWRSKGVVSVVEDQGNCGSCFIFAGKVTIWLFGHFKLQILSLLISVCQA